jgi:hypothetical protein
LIFYFKDKLFQQLDYVLFPRRPSQREREHVNRDIGEATQVIDKQMPGAEDNV